MLKRLLTPVIVAVSFLSSLTLGQRVQTSKRVKTIPLCTLGVKDAPNIRGMRLGMTAEEFLRLFPSAKPAYNSRPDVGAISYEVNQNENPDFAKGDVWLNGNWFTDGRLSYVSIEYSEFEPRNLPEFIDQVAAKLGLPSVGWRVDKYGANADLKCNGFTVGVGRDQFKAGEGAPRLSLSDDTAEAKFIAREKENKRREVEERRRKEQERRVFKP